MSIDPLQELDEEAQYAILELADKFIKHVVTGSCQLAKHRDSDTLEKTDVTVHLREEWGITVPGFESRN